MFRKRLLKCIAHSIAGALPAAAFALVTGTAVLAPAEAEARSCGGNGQRPCKVWERIPSCNSGLVEDFAKGRCVKITNSPKLACGRQGQRPCLVTERIPSCDSGLVEDFGKGRCVKITSDTPVRAGRPSQQSTKLSMCNNSSHAKVWAAYGYFNDQTGTWTTKGHWSLGRGECKTQDLGRYEGPVYMYGASADGSKWGGDDASLCMNPIDAFEIGSADKYCNGHNQEWVGTYKFDLVSGTNRWNYN